MPSCEWRRRCPGGCKWLLSSQVMEENGRTEIAGDVTAFSGGFSGDGSPCWWY